MQPRINSIFLVDCKDHIGKPIQTCDSWNDLKLLCSACHKQGTQIKLDHIREDILSYHNKAKSLREQRLQQLELIIFQINTLFQLLQEKINRSLKVIKQSLINLKHFEYIEQQWIKDTNSRVIIVWTDIYSCHGSQSKLKDSFKSNMLDKIQQFSDNLKQLNKEFYVPPDPPLESVPPQIQKPIVIEHLLNLEQEPRKIAMFEICHFKVLYPAD